MITEDFVSFETAKLLKKKGFDKDVPATDWWYDTNGEAYKSGNYSYSGAPFYDKDTCFNCPTLQMAMKWLREVHKLHIEFVLNQYVQNEEVVIENHYHFNVSRLDRFANEGGDCKFYNSYEQVCESAIIYCLNNLI